MQQLIITSTSLLKFSKFSLSLISPKTTSKFFFNLEFMFSNHPHELMNYIKQL